MLTQKTTHLIGQLGDLNSGEKVAIGGIVVKLRPHFTKDGKPMGFVTIEDVQGEIELVLFPRVWEKYVKMIKVESVLVVEGKVDNASATPKLLADKFELVQLDDVQNLPPTSAIETVPVKTESDY